ncbi:MAG: hypothetical protein ACP5O6_09950 [Candidatus Baltobacteraceae bacterium]
MAGIDPSALAMQAVLAAQTAIAEATLDLGAIAQSVIAQLKTGDLLSALVLPPSEGVDHISLFGQSLPAQLPPGIAPGDTLALQVTGFSPTQIFVRNLGAIDPQNPPEIANIEIPGGASAPAQASLLARAPAASTPNPAAQPTAPVPSEPALQSGAATNPRSAIAPPVEVFVAASVQPARRDLPAAPTQDSAPGRGAPAAERSSTEGPPQNVPAADASTQNAPLSARAAAESPAGTSPMLASELEARLATARGARILPRPPETQPGAAENPARGGAASSARGASLESPPPSISIRASSVPTETNPANVAAQPLGEEEQLLARLGVPATPATIAAARLSPNAPQLLATAFARAQSTLARFLPQPAVTTVRAAMAFVTTLDPANAVALPQQLAAYVRTILGSTEDALVTLAKSLAALEPAAPANTALPSSAPAAGTASPPLAGIAARISAAMPHAGEGVATAAPSVASPAREAAVVSAQNALNQDIKSTLVVLAQDPQSAALPGAANASACAGEGGKGAR